MLALYMIRYRINLILDNSSSYNEGLVQKKTLIFGSRKNANLIFFLGINSQLNNVTFIKHHRDLYCLSLNTFSVL